MINCGVVLGDVIPSRPVVPGHITAIIPQKRAEGAWWLLHTSFLPSEGNTT